MIKLDGYDRQDGFLYTFKDYTRAKIAFEKIKIELNEKTKEFIHHVKFGECQFEEISGCDVIEPFWLLVMPRPYKMAKLDNWICFLDLDVDDVYSGLVRVQQFYRYASVLEELHND